MSIYSFSRREFFGFTSVWLGISTPHLFAQSPAIPGEIMAALDRNASLGPLTVGWTERYRGAAPESRRVIWQDGKFYYSYTRTGLDEKKLSASREEEQAFDGTNVYMGSPTRKFGKGKALPMLMKLSVADMAAKQPDQAYFDPKYFVAAGIWLPSRFSDLVTPRQYRHAECSAHSPAATDSNDNSRKESHAAR
jgi:hypothetical protein